MVPSRKVFTAFLTFFLFLGMGPISYAAVDEQFIGSRPADVGLVPHYGFSANGQGVYVFDYNYLFGMKADGNVMNQSKVTNVGLCKSLEDSNCKEAQLIRYRAILGFCETETATDCIQEIRVKNSSGEAVPFSKEGSFPPSSSDHFTGDPRVGLPNGRSAPLISIPSRQHSGGNKYLVVVTYDSFKLPGSNLFEVPQITASIYGFKLNSTPLEAPGINTNLKMYDKLSMAINASGNPNISCPIYGTFGCAERFELPLDLALGLTVKVSRPIKGWLHGRVSDSQSKITFDKDGSQVLSVEGKPLIVPTVYAWVKKASAPESISRYYDSLPKPLGGSGYGCLDTLPLDCGQPRIPELWVSVMRAAMPNDESMREFLAWLPHLSDKATAAPTIWRVETIQNSGESDACYSDSKSVSGFVSTNATQYLSGPPTFNRSDQALDYKVAAPHYLPDGKEFLGSYDLIINSNVARCLYWFSDAPISASVSVTSADGKEKVATTALSEKDGWLSFSARGFTFSAPTIRVKLEQKIEKAPEPIASPQETKMAEQSSISAGTPIPAKKVKSITCTKGKSSRKVTGANPKCPTGWKRAK